MNIFPALVRGWQACECLHCIPGCGIEADCLILAVVRPTVPVHMFSVNSPLWLALSWPTAHCIDHGHPPVSASRVLALQACATMLSHNLFPEISHFRYISFYGLWDPWLLSVRPSHWTQSPKSVMSGLCLLQGRHTCALFIESNFNASF